MAVSPTLIKAAVVLVTDKRTWIIIGSILCGLIFTIVGIVAAFLNIFSYDDTGSNTVSAAYVQLIGELKSSYAKLDTKVEQICPALDKNQIHAVFYALYFGEEKNMDDDFYASFVECFVTREIDEESNEIVSPCDLDTALARLSDVTGKMTDNLTKQQVDELCAVLLYGISSAGNDGIQYPGPAPEAYSDVTFARLMSEATKYIGFPYVWGGSSPETSFDCSGFVCWAYTHSGVYSLPRTTAQGIYNQCAKISESEAKPGDLIFFTRTYVTSEPVTHIGIYVGENQMLHCGDPIGYASIKSDYWSSHFYGFGRLPIKMEVNE